MVEDNHSVAQVSAITHKHSHIVLLAAVINACKIKVQREKEREANP